MLRKQHTLTRFGRATFWGINKQSCLLRGEPGALHLSSLSLGTVNRIVLRSISTYRPLHVPPVSDSDISASF